MQVSSGTMTVLPSTTAKAEAQLDEYSKKVKEARVEMALANLVQKLYAQTGKNQSRTSLVSHALLAYKSAGGINLPRNLATATDALLGKKQS